MSEDILRRLRAHRQIDAFFLLAIAFLQNQNEQVLRAEDLLQELARLIAKEEALQRKFDSLLPLFLEDPDGQGYAALSWLLLSARMGRAQRQSRAQGIDLIFEPGFFEALKRGEKPQGRVRLHVRPEREQVQQQLRDEEGDSP